MLRSPRLFLLSFSICIILGQRASAQEMTIDTLLKKLPNRLEKYGTLEAKWEEVTLFPDGQGGLKRPANAHLIFNNQLHFRYEPNTKTSVKNVTTFDGEKNYSYTFQPNHEDQKHIGIVWKDKQYDELRNSHILPLLYYAYPLNPGYPAFSPQTHKLLPEQAIVKDSKCYVLQSIPAEGKGIYTFWIDPSKDFLIIKYTEETNQKVTATIELTYKQDEKYGWIPQEWTSTFLNNSPIRSTIKELTFNTEINPSVFTFEFPKQSLVFDRDEGHRYYIRKDGTHRVITNKESVDGFNFYDLERK